MSCEHIKSIKGKATKIFLGEIFSYKTLVCKDCGAAIWDSTIEKEFNGWIKNLYETNIEKFKIQIYLPKITIILIDKLLDQFPGVTRASLERALVMVYIDYIGKSRELSSKVTSMIDKEIVNSFENDNKQKTKILFRPIGIKRILAISELINKRPSYIVENSIKTLMALFCSEDQELRKFWKNEIEKHIEEMLKAA